MNFNSCLKYNTRRKKVYKIRTDLIQNLEQKRSINWNRVQEYYIQIVRNKIHKKSIIIEYWGLTQSYLIYVFKFIYEFMFQLNLYYFNLCFTNRLAKMIGTIFE